jgi:hypothetical protein
MEAEAFVPWLVANEHGAAEAVVALPPRQHELMERALCEVRDEKRAPQSATSAVPAAVAVLPPADTQAESPSGP